MTLQNSLRVQTSLRDLNRVLEWFEQFKQPAIPRKVWIQCQTALAEGFTNVVKHAHKDLSAETPIDIEVRITSEQLEIQIWDSGSTFDLRQVLERQPQTPSMEAFSGRGLNLICCLVDHFSYTRSEDDRNCLLMVKYYQSASNSDVLQ